MCASLSTTIVLMIFNSIFYNNVILEESIKRHKILRRITHNQIDVKPDYYRKVWNAKIRIDSIMVILKWKKLTNKEFKNENKNNSKDENSYDIEKSKSSTRGLIRSRLLSHATRRNNKTNITNDFINNKNDINSCNINKDGREIIRSNKTDFYNRVRNSIKLNKIYEMHEVKRINRKLGFRKGDFKKIQHRSNENNNNHKNSEQIENAIAKFHKNPEEFEFIAIGFLKRDFGII